MRWGKHSLKHQWSLRTGWSLGGSCMFITKTLVLWSRRSFSIWDRLLWFVGLGAILWVLWGEQNSKMFGEVEWGPSEIWLLVQFYFSDYAPGCELVFFFFYALVFFCFHFFSLDEVKDIFIEKCRKLQNHQLKPWFGFHNHPFWFQTNYTELTLPNLPAAINKRNKHQCFK